MKIKTDFLAGTISIITASIVATAFVLAMDAKETLNSDIKDRSKLLMNGIKGIAVETFIKNDQLSLNYCIKEAAQTGGILYIFVTDNNGKIIASNDPKNDDRYVPDTFPAVAANNGPDDIIAGEAMREAVNFKETIEMKNGNTNAAIGKIYAGFDRNYISSRINLIYIKSGFIALGAIALGVLLVLYTTGKVTTPLKQIIEGTERIAGGDLKYRIKVNVKNEFQSLANSFNAMTDSLNGYYEGVISAFAIAVNARNEYDSNHGYRVAKYAVALGKASGMKSSRLENLRIASMLMNTGNLGVNDAVLEKKEALSPEEFIQIQKHPEISVDILKNIPAMKDIVPIIAQHHERYDGMGYPAGLKGDRICTEAKILNITDAYDAMISGREYKKAMTPEEAAGEIRANEGKQFDPELAGMFAAMIDKGIFSARDAEGTGKGTEQKKTI